MRVSSRPHQAVLASAPVSVPPASNLSKLKLQVLNKVNNHPKVKDKVKGVHKVSEVPDILTGDTKLKTGLSMVSTEAVGTGTLDGNSRRCAVGREDVL